LEQSFQDLLELHLHLLRSSEQCLAVINSLASSAINVQGYLLAAILVSSLSYIVRCWLVNQNICWRV